MIAAIYARKSTEQAGVADDEKSVARQIEHAGQYATRKGWTVADEHVYQDDGVSGAEFVRREGLNALLGALGRRPPFDALIISEDSRLGRESYDTARVIRTIVEAGVRLYSYLDDREITLGSALEKLLVNIRAFQSEAEREQAGIRTHDAMRRKAGKAHVTGGRLYGYDNIRREDGVVVRRVNAGQAAVVARIYEMYADGLGFKRIAERLNQERIPGPRGTPWRHTAVRELLHNPLFGGTIVWNRTKRTTRHGRAHVKVARSPAERVEVSAPELRVIPDELWACVQAKLEANGAAFARSAGGKLVGRPAYRDLESKHLLVGFMRCGRCEGPMIASPRSNQQRKTYDYYRCSAASKSGKAICAAPSVRADRIEPAVIAALQGWLGEQRLNEVLDAAVAEARARDRSGDVESQRAAIHAELARFATERQKFLRLIAETDDPPTFILGRAREIEAQERRLRGELDVLVRAGQQSAEAAVEQVRQRIGVIRKMLAAPVAQARSALRRLGVKVDLEQEAVEGVMLRSFTIAGTFQGLAQGVGFGGGFSVLAHPDHVPAGAKSAPVDGGALSLVDVPPEGSGGGDQSCARRWCREGESNPHGLAPTRF